MKRMAIVGAGGHAQVVADILFQQKKSGQPIHLVGYIDDNTQLHGKSFLGSPVLGATSLLIDHKIEVDEVILAIGANKMRQKIARLLKSKGINFGTAIHPTAVIGSGVKIEAGTMICANVVINPETHIGSHVIINTAATVDHHSVIEDFVHLAPGTHTGGAVHIKKGAFLGIGALILPGQTVGSWATVGGGALVRTNILDEQTVVGIPARPIKR